MTIDYEKRVYRESEGTAWNDLSSQTVDGRSLSKPAGRLKILHGQCDVACSALWLITQYITHANHRLNLLRRKPGKQVSSDRRRSYRQCDF